LIRTAAVSAEPDEPAMGKKEDVVMPASELKKAT
jgi:hypothetical protein